MLPELTGPLQSLTPIDPNVGENRAQPPSCFPEPQENEGINSLAGHQAD
jgi:hypothetical protein